MYKMVDDIAVNVQGQNVLKKVLYLTNNQAALFDEAAMERCIQALDFGEPKFIIRLSPSHGVASQEHIAHEELEGTPIAEFTTDYALDSKPDVAYNTSELDKLDERVVQTQVILFMKTCILPLAHRTRATIFISGVNDCYLGTALAVVAIEEQARLGKDCPFNVIATAWQGEVHSRAVTPGDSRSLAAQILRGSTAWKRRLPFIQQTFAALALSGDDQLQRCDLTLAASHYILFECIDEENGDFNFAPMNNFDSAFMSCLMKKVPSIVIQSHCISDITSLSDYALRGIPVLLLDSTERAVTLKNVPANYEPKTILAKKSNAFPDIPVDRLHKIKVDSSGSMDLAGRQELLEICCSMIEDKWAALTAAGVVDALDSSLLAFLHRVLHFKAGHNGGISVGDVPLYARIRELEKLQQANKESKIDAVPLELASRAVTFIQTRDLALKRMAQLNRVEMWMQRNNDSHALWEEAASYRDDLLLKCEEIKANDGLAKENVDVRMWLVYFNVLTSPCVFSGSIHDIEELKQTLSSVAKIDRLPTSNSLEALRIISDAWDHVETYSHMADSYKRATKISYQLLLVCGVLVTLAVIFQSSEQNSINFQSRIYIIALSFFTSGIAAYVAFVNPAVRWQQLRAAAVTIESNVWMFRTRTGDYRATTNINDVGAEEQLKQMIQTVKTGVLDGADIKNSAFFSRSKTFNEHKQHGLHDAGFGVQDSYFGADDSPKRPGICERLWSWCFLPQSSATVAPSVSNARVSSAPDALSTVRLDFKRTGDIEHNGGTASVYECASLAQFLDKINSSNPEDKRESVDNHYHPLKPEHYIKYRAVPILNFYKNRIPRCHTIRNATQVLLVLSGMATGVLAILDLSVWAAVVSAVWWPTRSSRATTAS